MKPRTIWEVLYTHPRLDGVAGDGSIVARFRKQDAAESFAARNTYCGQPCKAEPYEPSPQLYKRWLREGKIA